MILLIRWRKCSSRSAEALTFCQSLRIRDRHGDFEKVTDIWLSDLVHSLYWGLFFCFVLFFWWARIRADRSKFGLKANLWCYRTFYGYTNFHTKQSHFLLLVFVSNGAIIQKSICQVYIVFSLVLHMFTAYNYDFIGEGKKTGCTF